MFKILTNKNLNSKVKNRYPHGRAGQALVRFKIKVTTITLFFLNKNLSRVIIK